MVDAIVAPFSSWESLPEEHVSATYIFEFFLVTESCSLKAAMSMPR